VRWAALALLALTLTGCETTAEKSAKLQRAAKQTEREAAHREQLAQRALAIGRPSTRVHALSASLIHSSSTSAAVVVTLRNSSAVAIRAVPVSVTVLSASGASLYANRTAGQSPTLLRAALIPAHGEAIWIDDQIKLAGDPARAVAVIGEGQGFTGATPDLSVEGAHQVREPGGEAGVEGSIANHSGAAESEVLVNAVVRRAGRIVAAGRAVLQQLPTGTPTPFQLYFVGDPHGGQLQISVVASPPPGS
jgi:uncharacterized protein (TIGR02588 family)